ncbi:MAG: D-aminoacyl-tRNA deacylase [Syntrophales bacterium]|jgi:D-tyrosyl-tRNA(Tyr) deacylase|nr:D-aminoacyl-tRNA deacylase [Syntrophales bacterium]MCU0584049.1 D-aminoacyl-tRNA deacylase [Syntrophales bacterium]
MKAVIQRVESASVSVEGSEISRIGAGLLVLLGVEKGDSEKDADFLLDKIIHLRIFEDGEGKMNRSLADVSGELLVVSQFTLLADCRKGRRPSFTDAADPAQATALYEYMLSRAKEKVARVGEGRFQTTMKVELVNSGPVTILLDSRR